MRFINNEDRLRQLARENIFMGLIYGVEEMKQGIEGIEEIK